MAGKFEIRKSKSGQFVFNLLTPEGRIILSSQLYKGKPSVKTGIASVRNNSRNKAAFECKADGKKKVYFVLRAANRLIIGRSERYESTAEMENGMASVRKNAPRAKIVDCTI
jgi:uncharacterized protein